MISGGPDGARFVTDGPLPANVHTRLGPLAVDQPAALDGAPAGALRWATLEGPLSPDSLRPAWLKALWAEPTAIVLPWNDFAHGRAIEPTLRDGDSLLVESSRWIEAFHHPQSAATMTGTTTSGSPPGIPDVPPVGPPPVPRAS